jgi:3D (Asp-Asp-Asp) domain-containing protein
LNRRQLKLFGAALTLILLSLWAVLFWGTHSSAPPPKHAVTRHTEALKAKEPSRGEQEIVMMATAYDLSVQCCGKSIGHPARGITKSGYDLNGKSRTEAMTISSNTFPLGTRLELAFGLDRSQYNGIYTVRDTGNMKPGVIDVFVGDYGERVSNETINFGRQIVKVQVIN